MILQASLYQYRSNLSRDLRCSPPGFALLPSACKDLLTSMLPRVERLQYGRSCRSSDRCSYEQDNHMDYVRAERASIGNTGSHERRPRGYAGRGISARISGFSQAPTAKRYRPVGHCGTSLERGSARRTSDGLLRFSGRHPAEPNRRRCPEVMVFSRSGFVGHLLSVRADFIYGQWLGKHVRLVRKLGPPIIRNILWFSRKLGKRP